jgi:hypothetical protein
MSDLRELNRDNPESRWHTEQRTPTYKHSWACVPLTDAVEAREELLAELRRRVEALPCTIDCRETPNDHPVLRSAVLDLLRGEGRG